MTLSDIRENISLAETLADEVDDALATMICANTALVEIKHEVVEASGTLHRALEMLDEEAMRGN